MFTGTNNYTRREHSILANRFDASRWKYAIKESWFGAPPAFEWDASTSGNLIHQAYHLHMLDQISRVKLKDYDFIIELGGGYGALAYIAYRLGFKGSYIIFDIPEMLALQRYYLYNVLSPGENIYKVSFFRADEDISYGIRGILDRALVVGLWSLSESPIPIREQFLGMDGLPYSYLFAFQDSWIEINNQAYFKDFAARNPVFEWSIWPAAEADTYLIGTRDTQ
jgi:hypothetical protein